MAARGLLCSVLLALVMVSFDPCCCRTCGRKNLKGLYFYKRDGWCLVVGVCVEFILGLG